MKRFLSFLCTAILIVPILCHSLDAIALDQSITKVVIVRHAEKQGVTQDPPLSEVGKKRANTLAKMLSSANISAIFSTDTMRTKSTAAILSDQQDIPITDYSSVDDLIDKMKSDHLGQNFLVVGHSPNVPKIIEHLGIRSAPDIHNEYNNLFVVTVVDDVASLTHLKYEPQNS